MKNLHLLMPALAVLGCGGSDPAAVDAGDDTPPADAAPGTPDAAPPPAIPDLQLCTIPDPELPGSAFVVTSDADWVHFDCAAPCADWTACTAPLIDPMGNPLMSARGTPIDVLAFVVDGMGGHLAFTTDGNDVVVTHAGSGGNTFYNSAFDNELQANSDLKTVTLGWMDGSLAIFNGAGWFTRTSAAATTVRALAARPAAAIQWVKDHFAVGKRLGTVGSSMGTAATFGARVWYGLDPILDYQMLIGGPGFWDVNAGCGRVHLASGWCDVDTAPCAGVANSSFGDNDPACGADATNQCRVPTIMAPDNGPYGSAYNDCINYVTAGTSCTMLADDERDPALDASSLAYTVDYWSFRGRIDFVANEGGIQPPDADQGMGEGHMLAIYAQIQSAKTWTDNEGQHHGDSWRKIPALVHDSALRVIDGMSGQ